MIDNIKKGEIMKKLFTLFAFIAVTMCAMATDYTDNLVVNVGGAPLSSEQATISVTENEGKYTLTLKNFSITGLGGIGTIEVSDIEGTTSNGVTTLSYDGNVTIQAGDDESVTSWMMAGQSVPLTIDAELYSDEKMYAEIGINYMNVLQVDVVFGTKQETSASTDYTDNLVVNVGGAPFSNEEATISVTEANGVYTLALKNFSITGLGGIGTIEISGIEGTTDDAGNIVLAYSGDVTIQAGDDESVSSWMMAGQSVPVTLNAEIYSSEKMYAEIGINYMGMLQVDVVFGSKETTGINTVNASGNSDVEAIYDINGNKLNDMQKGINIIRKADGTTIKVLKK